ncbi:MAG: MBL fold metallo-hydrolase [Gammaproteobacteria bacterium]|nr:MBL fold metallo-hydrolase [Gammaproteobacteria bacterium]
MNLSFYGATGEVTGSCFLIEVGDKRLLVECGLIQGSSEHERHNQDPFPFDPARIDAVVLTHAHLDHSGRLPLLVKQGYQGPIYTHAATVDLCRIMLEDAAYLNEKEAHWENRKRERRDQELLEPLYTRADARLTDELFVPLEYHQRTEILPGVMLTLHDAGHILGSAIAELELSEDDQMRRLVFSGDLGHRGEPILRDPDCLHQADLLIMESTYGDRQHRDWNATWSEMGEVFRKAREDQGNILIPSFAVGRTQMLLHSFRRHFDDWGLGNWHIFLDSPMAIKATEVYAHHMSVYNARAREVIGENSVPFQLPNLHMTRDSEESMALNRIRSGAIIIAGSGMCTGGRIKHHLKHNIWRRQAHVMMVGFQARGTLGRALVDGASEIRLWGEQVNVHAEIHTIGGLSAHADQQGLLGWYGHFDSSPPVALVHGETEAMQALAEALRTRYHCEVSLPKFRQTLNLLEL